MGNNNSKRERKVLSDFFSETHKNTQKWIRTENWGNNEAPLGHWKGIKTDEETALVTSIELSHNHIWGTFPPQMCEFQSLEHLNFDGNRLKGRLPISIANLSNLTYLNLRANEFSGPLPDSIGMLHQLVYLYLNENNFSGILPPSLGKLQSLTYLSLEHNCFSGSIPGEFGNLSNLTYLGLGYNLLEGILPASLGALNSLSWLDLGNNKNLSLADNPSSSSSSSSSNSSSSSSSISCSKLINVNSNTRELIEYLRFQYTSGLKSAALHCSSSPLSADREEGEKSGKVVVSVQKPVITVSKYGLGLSLKNEDSTGRAVVVGFKTLPDSTPNPCLACSPPLLINDVVVGLNDIPTRSYDEIVALVGELVGKKADTITLWVERSTEAIIAKDVLTASQQESNPNLDDDEVYLHDATPEIGITVDDRNDNDDTGTTKNIVNNGYSENHDVTGNVGDENSDESERDSLTQLNPPPPPPPPPPPLPPVLTDVVEVSEPDRDCASIHASNNIDDCINLEAYEVSDNGSGIGTNDDSFEEHSLCHPPPPLPPSPPPLPSILLLNSNDLDQFDYSTVNINTDSNKDTSNNNDNDDNYNVDDYDYCGEDSSGNYYSSSPPPPIPQLPSDGDLVDDRLEINGCNSNGDYDNYVKVNDCNSNGDNSTDGKVNDSNSNDDNDNDGEINGSNCNGDNGTDGKINDSNSNGDNDDGDIDSNVNKFGNICSDPNSENI